MSDAIAVLNAGSSSLKFSLFAERGNVLELAVRRQIEGLHTAPRFVAKDRHGKTLGEKSWADGVKLGHDGALDRTDVQATGGRRSPGFQQEAADAELVVPPQKPQMQVQEIKDHDHRNSVPRAQRRQSTRRRRGEPAFDCRWMREGVP